MSGSERVIVFALFNQVTQLDFTGPLQILGHLPQTKVVIASIDGGDVSSDVGLTFCGVEQLARVKRCDVLFVPGGYGQIAAMMDPRYMNEIARLARGARYLTAVCTGSLILAAAGLLEGKRAACHWASRHFLADFGAIPDEGRVVRDGNVITGGGVTAGIDFALTLAAELDGRDVAQTIQLLIEYAPAPPFDSGRPENALPSVVNSVSAGLASTKLERRQAIDKLLAQRALERNREPALT